MNNGQSIHLKEKFGEDFDIDKGVLAWHVSPRENVFWGLYWNQTKWLVFIPDLEKEESVNEPILEPPVKSFIELPKVLSDSDAASLEANYE